MAPSKRSGGAGPAPGQKDKRRARRREVLYPVAIESLDGWSIVPCTIQDVSAGGARLGVEELAEVPGEFILRLAENRPRSRHCHLVWRRGAAVGVRFILEEEETA